MTPNTQLIADIKELIADGFQNGLSLDDIANNILIATRVQPQSPWMAIDTAPHGETVLLGYWYDGVWMEEVGQASWGWRRGSVSNLSAHGQATHWMPQPAPPVTRPDRGGGQ